MAVSADSIKKLREETGAGIMDCRKALEESTGDLERAALLLRERGAAKALSKENRRAQEGSIMAYVHHGGKLGSLVEVNCETDFVARNEEFITLAKELSMQVAATSPRWVAKEDVPGAFLEAQKEEFRKQAAELGKPADAFVQEKTDQLLSQLCLLEQPYIRDAAIIVSSLITEKVAKFGERIRVKRFVVFKLGEGDEQPPV
ncbi:MAG: translation elongation factor Ts [Candidatus Coatesbacteria bacterium]